MWYGVATLVGTIIGVGIFGLPYAASRAGFFVQLAYLGVFAVVFTVLHLMYGEIMLRTTERYRLPGYAGFYFGSGVKRIMQGVALIGLLGSMVVYVLVGGSFLSILHGGEYSSFLYQLAFWIIMSGIVVYGLRMVKRTEIVMLICMITIIALIFFFSIPHLTARHLTSINPNNFFFPYGITMFALAGTAAIPALRDIFYTNEKKMKKAIVAGTLIPAALYAVFVFSILGVAGSSTSEDAFSGLHVYAGGSVEFVGALFGVFAVATSYIVFGLYLRDMLWYDFNVSRRIGMAIAVISPIVCAFLYPGSYITIIGFLGAIAGGIEAIFISAAFMRARAKGDRVPEFALSLPATVLYGLIFLFTAGIGYTLLIGW